MTAGGVCGSGLFQAWVKVARCCLGEGGFEDEGKDEHRLGIRGSLSER